VLPLRARVLGALLVLSLSAPAIAAGQSLSSAWKGALGDSIRLLGIEHGVRIAFQPKTRRELPGPFWNDYLRSIKAPRTWEDGDSWFVNYIGHPIHGAASGRVWIDHDAKGRRLEIGTSRAYWASRGRAAAWAAGYSVQFEFGPLSEASIGNVGLHPGTTGWVDHVVTPVGAMGLTVAEDALDKYFVQWVERHTENRFFRGAMRIVFAPSWMMANLAEGHAPWFRPTRPLR
jgi:hypothetical protein